MPIYGFVYPLEPSLAVIKYQTPKTADPAAADLNFHVETWDYHTVRLSWNVPTSIADLVSSGTQLCITRSTYGFPLTTEDGVKVAFDLVSNLVGVLNYNSQTTLNEGNDLARAPSPYASLYDNNLEDGGWYYYSLFFFVQGEWRKMAQHWAVLPFDFRTRDKLYALLPEYYRHIDEEYPGVTGNKDLFRFLTVLGFEMDYTRTMTQYIEHSYDIDRSPQPLLQALGTQNLGVPLEGGLGDIRYRSMLSAINRLYNDRGTAYGVRKLVEAATKYSVITTKDINMMILPDDSSFATGLGSWSIPFGAHAGDTHSIVSKLVTPPWGTAVHNSLITDLAVDSTIPFADVTPIWQEVYGGADGLSKTGMLISTTGDARTGTQGVMLTCGYGTMFQTGRRTLDTVGPSTDLPASTAVLANPYFNAIKCKPDTPYTFSFFMQRITALSGAVNGVGAGILWYAAPPSISNNNATEQLSENNLVYEDHYLVIPTTDQMLIQAAVSNKALTSNVATLTTSAAHPFNIGDTVTVAGVDTTFNGTYLVTAKTSNTISYAKTAANVGSTASTGSIKTGGDASLTRQRYSVVSISPSYQQIYAVPYIVLGVADGTGGNPVQRVVSNCMFYVAQQTGIISPSITPTPTPTSYYILGPMILGDESQFLGGD